MEALRAALTPQRFKKQRVDELLDEEGGNDSDIEIEEVKKEVVWTTSRQHLLHGLAHRLKAVEDTLLKMEPAVAQSKFAADMAKEEADEANVHAGLAHGASEEASTMASELKTKFAEVTAAMVKREEVSKMVQEAVAKLSNIAMPSPSLRTSSARLPEGQTEKFARTVVVGGFEMDSKKESVEADVAELLKGVAGVQEIYAYRRGSIGFARFRSVDDMWAYLKKVNVKGAERPKVRGMPIWMSASRTPADRNKRKIFYSCKRVLVDVGVAKEEDVEYVLKSGILWIGRHRVAEWKPEEEKLEWITEALRRAGVDVDTKNLDDAVQEKMSVAK